MADEPKLEYDITFYDGKYRLTYDKEMKPQAFRHGEEWHAFTTQMFGSSVILALVQEVTMLRETMEGISSQALAMAFHSHDLTESFQAFEWTFVEAEKALGRGEELGDILENRVKFVGNSLVPKPEDGAEARKQIAHPPDHQIPS